MPTDATTGLAETEGTMQIENVILTADGIYQSVQGSNQYAMTSQHDKNVASYSACGGRGSCYGYGGYGFCAGHSESLTKRLMTCGSGGERSSAAASMIYVGGAMLHHSPNIDPTKQIDETGIILPKYSQCRNIELTNFSGIYL